MCREAVKTPTGSCDCRDARSSDSSPPVLSQAVEAVAEFMGSYDDAERMVKEVPTLILSGDIPDILKPKHSRRRLD